MTNSVSELMIEAGQKARAASRRMAAASTADKNKALLRLAELLEAKKEDIFAANERDLVRAKKNGLKESFVDRLRVTEKVLRLMAEGARQTAALPDPVGEISEIAPVAPRAFRSDACECRLAFSESSMSRVQT